VTTPPQYKKILDYIAVGRDEGAQVALGGGPADKQRLATAGLSSRRSSLA
jgi:aldehyde dehydrogenase (NAD+)